MLKTSQWHGGLLLVTPCVLRRLRARGIITSTNPFHTPGYKSSVSRSERPLPPYRTVREEGDTTILPVVEEVVVFERRLILKEEVHIRRVQVAERYTKTVTTREQTAEINGTEAGSSESENNRPPLSSQQEQNV
jgi:hypothetical protein